MEARKYEYVVVGSGMGGSTTARELTKRGKEVLVLEAGKREEQVGTGRDCLRYYDANRLTEVPRHSREGTIIWRTRMAGGSTVVSCGNGVRSLQGELADIGIALEDEFTELEAELSVAPIDPDLLSEGSHALKAAADELGYSFTAMPKFIKADKCAKCSNCAYGCRHGAKWTALDQLDMVEESGGDVELGVTVDRVLIEAGKVTGIEGHRNKKRVRVATENVILAAGGLGTPVILLASGIDAGKGLFIDALVNTYGRTTGLNQLHEPTMALVGLDWHDESGFLLSPFTNSSRIVRFAEAGATGAATSPGGMIGMMTKIKDDRAGVVYQDGTISKPMTSADRGKLDEGSARSREILVKAGADPRSVFVSKVQGGHPGGTAAIGEVVDVNLETKVSGLFCCDASVLPTAPGLPPILTIGALGKYLARQLA
jgi:choline dehydrogenase-like flavoprotein